MGYAQRKGLYWATIQQAPGRPWWLIVLVFFARLIVGALRVVVFVPGLLYIGVAELHYHLKTGKWYG